MEHNMKKLNCSLAVLAVLCVFSFAQAAEKPPKTPVQPADVPPVGTGPLLLDLTFEDVATGQIPKGFTKQGAVAVVEDVAHTGKKSLRMEPAVNGARTITLKGEILTQLGGEHWGRLYFKVKSPAPSPDTGVIHSTIVSGTATSPSAKDPIDVRMLGSVENNKGMFQYLYNVQPRTKRPEFGKGGSYKNKYSDEWTLAEWYVDYATQTYRLFINGEEIPDVALHKGADKFEGVEIPAVFETLTFGWNNYQKAGTGFTVWIDDIALAKDRIGTRGMPAAAPVK